MLPMRSVRPRRSCLYMPGANARALEKARTLAADTLILDLEDAVAPDAKATARDLVNTAVRDRGFGLREVVIRINGLDTPWGMHDLQMAVAAGPDAILAPKVRSARDIETLDAAMAEAGAGADTALWLMIEMPEALFALREIAETAQGTRLAAFVMGTNDLAKEMRARMTPDRLAFLPALGMTVAAARAFGLIAIDGVYNDIANEAGLLAECEQGRTLGFDGKTLIHPDQITVTNEAFAPSAAEIDLARRQIAAFAAVELSGQGVAVVDGKIVENLHVATARKILALADAIAQPTAE